MFALITSWVVTQFIYGLTWQRLLRLCHIDIPYKKSASLILRTQIAKYLPLNVLHFAGRVFLAKSEKIKTASLSYSILMEAGCFLCTGICLGIPSLLRFNNPLSSALTSLALLPVGIFSCLFAYYISHRRFIKEAPPIAPKKATSLFAIIILLLVATYLANASICYALLHQINSNPGLPFWHFVSAFSLAWVAGYVVPGSPGGLGVREAVFTFVLPSSVEIAPFLLLIILFRITSILGDAASFFISFRYTPDNK